MWSLMFWVPDYPAVRDDLRAAYDLFGLEEHSAEPGRVAGCPDDADVQVRGEEDGIAAFVQWLVAEGIDVGAEVQR